LILNKGLFLRELKMKRLATSLLLLGLLTGAAAPVQAQFYGGLDACGSLMADDGLRIYFGPGVACGCGGIIADPMIGCDSRHSLVEAYLVLTNPTAAELTGWQCQFRVAEQGALYSILFYGNGSGGLYPNSTFSATFPDPMPLTGEHNVLARFEVLVEEGGNPYGYEMGVVEFYIGPAVGFSQEAPGYFDGDGRFVACNNLVSDFNGWEVPCMTLNGVGVTDEEAHSWDHVRAMYR
jgi:hypothetical protein